MGDHVFGHNDLRMTFDLIRVRYVVRSGLVMLMTKFGQNRLNNVGARADYMLLGMGGMDVDRRRKKWSDEESSSLKSLLIKTTRCNIGLAR